MFVFCAFMMEIKRFHKTMKQIKTHQLDTDKSIKELALNETEEQKT